MGAAFTVPVIESDDLALTIAELKVRGVHLLATVLDSSAKPLVGATRPGRLALVFGNEAHGLSEREVGLCAGTVTIPMAPGADSLNVSCAAAIFLHHFTQVATDHS